MTENIKVRTVPLPVSDQRCAECGRILGSEPFWCGTCNDFVDDLLVAESATKEIDADPDDYFGGCPDCGYPGTNDGFLNIGRDHWYVCHLHRTKWRVGSNLFDAWRHESENRWERNLKLLETYREVDCLDSRREREFVRKAEESAMRERK